MKPALLSSLALLTTSFVLTGCGLLQPIGGLGKAILGVPGAALGGDTSWHDPSDPTGHPAPSGPALPAEPHSPGGIPPVEAVYAPLPLTD